MTYLRYTYVDAHTGIPCDQAPCRNGPAPPPIPGLSYLWAPEGQYPTARPVFYGHCPDAADTALLGVLTVLSEAEYAAALADEIAARCVALHERRRARRTEAETGGFLFRDHLIDSDRDSIQRIAQAVAAAGQSLWGGVPYAVPWTCADDSELALDAAGMLAMQTALAEHGALCHARSRALRAAIDGADTLADLATVALEMETGWPTITAQTTS
jgi:hypothetical protein